MQEKTNEYDRVTSVLGAFSGFDLIPAEILANACTRGTAVHEEIKAQQQKLWTADECQLPIEYQGYVDSYNLWSKDKKFVLPERFYDQEHYITGECDSLYLVGEDTYSLVDFKTSGRVYGKQKEKMQAIWGMQLSAYAYMANRKGFVISKIELVHLSKSGGEPEIHDFTKDRSDFFMDFFRLLRFYRMFFKNRNELNWEWI